jgi:hypothetical protein
MLGLAMIPQTHWVTFSVSIRIVADTIDVQRLENLVGLKSTSFLTKGRRIKGLVYRGSRDKWVCNIAKSDNLDLGVLLLQVEQVIRSRAQALAAVKDGLGYETELYISRHSDLASGGFELPISLLSTLVAANLPLRFSLLSWGNIAEEEKGGEEKGEGKSTQFES